MAIVCDLITPEENRCDQLHTPMPGASLMVPSGSMSLSLT
jgi:hypothetical protein